jgi:hypothetical protein
MHPRKALSADVVHVRVGCARSDSVHTVAHIREQGFLPKSACFELRTDRTVRQAFSVPADAALLLARGISRLITQRKDACLKVDAPGQIRLAQVDDSL